MVMSTSSHVLGSALTFVACAVAQSATSTYSETSVPTGTPIPGNYAGPLRPQVHFSPPVGFMNDPNGMFKDQDGIYHLYYQYNPTDTVAGNQHWGHATSPDLYTWTNQPIALFPGSPDEGIFSGSAVIDVNNTSGFFPDQDNGVVAIYTVNTPERETQNIAYSYDNGYSFIKYDGNPVINSNSTNFRDPKVIWHAPSERWVMVVAYPVEFGVGIFSSENLKDWTPESNFSHSDLPGLQWECPNLVEMPVMSSFSESLDTLWVMLISINPGAPLGGSITQYLSGTFNGTHFETLDATANLTDFAKDNYAGQFFYNVPADQDQISINWASNWQYTNEVPTAQEGWRSAMSVPRGNYLIELETGGMSMISYPYDVFSVVDSELAYDESLGNNVLSVNYSDVTSGALYFEANITGLTDSASLAGTLNFTLSSSSTGENVSGGTDVSTGDIWLDRGNTPDFSNPSFSKNFSATGFYDGGGAWRVSGIVDRSIIELFLNGGELSATSVFFPTKPLDTMVLEVQGLNDAATVSVGVWALKAAWLESADASGNVVGNVTGSGNATRRAAAPLRWDR